MIPKEIIWRARRGARAHASVVLSLAFVATTVSRQEPARPLAFRNVAVAAGIDFVYQHSPTPEKHYIESAPAGLAVFDYNGDGRPDIFFTNGASSPGLDKADSRFRNRLYRNDGGMHFTDVTVEAGVRGVGYAMGAAAADYDNDGDVDLFVAGVRHNQLLRNTGRGTFEDVTAGAGIASGEWAVAGGWLDYDSDGRLDLFVVNYVKWSPDFARFCGDETKNLRVYCHPRFFDGLPNRLYRNRGDGTFEDVSAKSGILKHVGKGMSAAFADYDDDGDLDVYVTNDTVPNFLFRNRGDGTFEETALFAGAAVPEHGRAVSSMGVDFQDYDNDLRPDLHYTALDGETFPLFRNLGRGNFIETTHKSGLAQLTVRRSGWCTVFVDLDNDGLKDIFTANSHANDRIEAFQSMTWAQPNSVFRNTGDGRFEDVSAMAGADFQTPAVHRGCGVADFNGDGRLDIVVLALGSRAELWENVSGAGHNWLIVRLVGAASNRDGIGARVTLADQMRVYTTSSGYASSSHAGAHFGLGAQTNVARLEVHWPGGRRQIVENVRANQTLEVREPGQ